MSQWVHIGMWERRSAVCGSAVCANRHVEMSQCSVCISAYGVWTWEANDNECSSERQNRIAVNDERSGIDESTYALILSVTVPIWLTLSKRPLHAFFLMASWMRVGLVTVKSSPTICVDTDLSGVGERAGTQVRCGV